MCIVERACCTHSPHAIATWQCYCCHDSLQHADTRAPQACRRKRGTREKQQERQQRRAVSDARRLNAIEDRCPLCFGSSKRQKGLLLSVGRLTYMALPARGSLADGHVVIAPTDHVPSFRAADEDVFEELKNFRKCLIQMYGKQVCMRTTWKWFWHVQALCVLPVPNIR